MHSDSQLIVNQIKGLYKVKHPDLRPLHERARNRPRAWKHSPSNIFRAKKIATRMPANAALDSTGGVKPAYGSPPRAHKPVPSIRQSRRLAARPGLYLDDLHVGQRFTSGTHVMEDGPHQSIRRGI